jgi:hypothetical protein
LPTPYLALLPELLALRPDESILIQPGGAVPGLHGMAMVAPACGKRTYVQPRMVPEIDTNGFPLSLPQGGARGAWLVSGQWLAGASGVWLRRFLLGHNALDALLCLPAENWPGRQGASWLLLVRPWRQRRLIGWIGSPPNPAPRLGSPPMTGGVLSYREIVAAHAAWQGKLAHPHTLPLTWDTALYHLERFGL